MSFALFSNSIFQNACVLLYVVLIIITFFIGKKNIAKAASSIKGDFEDLTQDISISILLLLLGPVIYFILSFFGLNAKFMINDPLPFIMLLGGASSLNELRKAKKNFVKAPAPLSTDKYFMKFKEFSAILSVNIFISFFSMIYGAIMVVFTNLSSNDGLKSILWFVTFIFTAYPIILTSWSKVLVYVSEEYKQGHVFNNFSGR